MAFGTHWEWRGFGRLSPALRARLGALPALFPPAPTHDEYLWAPGAAVNVKLRWGALKFKRLLATEGEFGSWVEDPGEFLLFPLGAATLAQLGKDLGVSMPAALPRRVDREALLNLLQNAVPPVRRVSVRKLRVLREWEDRGMTTPVTVDTAEISEPESSFSVGLEHADRRALARCLAALGLASELRRMNYLEAIALWAEGLRVADGNA
ncbi:MAG: hypothetical protein HYZ53_02150 [Planctomycetes bacterium]|nr:hypothetical protein [Planctomycetota bacterium]